MARRPKRSAKKARLTRPPSRFILSSLRKFCALLFLSAPFAASVSASTLGIETGYHHIDYKEELTLPAKSSESGWLKLIGLAAHDYFGPFHVSGRLAYAWGNLKYDGADLFTSAPVVGHDDHNFLTVEMIAGLEIMASLRLYGGFLYRRWSRPLSAYHETYNLWFAPAGLRWQSDGGDKFSYGLDVSARPLVKGSLLATMSDMGRGWDDKTLPVSGAIGWRLEVPLTFPLSRDAGLILAAFYQVLNIGEGDTVQITSNGQPVANASGQAQGALEPASRTVEYGARLSLAFPL